MESIEVRKAGVKDVTSIVSIQIECDLSPWPRTAYDEEITRADAIALVALITPGGAPVGFITGRVIAGDGESSFHAEIYNLGVYKAVQSRGVGAALLNRFIDICSEFQVSKVFLEVRQSNLSAIGFYRSQGFEKIGERKNFYVDPVENAEIMAIKLD